MKRFSAYLLAMTCFIMLITQLAPRAYASSSSPTAGTVQTSTAQLNVRSGPSASSGVVGTLSSGSVVMLYGQSDGWWRVGLSGGKYGYCAASFINEMAGSAARKVSVSALNVRSGPSTSYAVKTVLYRGTVVVKLSASGDFAKVVYDGSKVGYASAASLTSLSGSSSSVDAYPAISLSVPSYKQTDSRWASTEVGDSGKTIAVIGCATAALAMTESYRTGSSITPDEMEGRLTYTSGGSLYWPDNYTLVDALTFSQLYQKLKSGVPVIVGCVNSSGGTHFVVVTGYTGGSTLSASGFTINDPGSSSRTTLSAFLSVYPTLFRRVYY